MKAKLRKPSVRFGLVLAIGAVFLVVANAHAINNYCSKAVFSGLKSVIDSQSVGENL